MRCKGLQVTVVHSRCGFPSSHSFICAHTLPAYDRPLVIAEPTICLLLPCYFGVFFLLTAWNATPDLSFLPRLKWLPEPNSTAVEQVCRGSWLISSTLANGTWQGAADRTKNERQVNELLNVLKRWATAQKNFYSGEKVFSCDWSKTRFRKKRPPPGTWIRDKDKNLFVQILPTSLYCKRNSIKCKY